MDHTCLSEISRDGEAGAWYVSESVSPGLVAEVASEGDLLGRIRELVPEWYELDRHVSDESVPEAARIR